MQYGYRAENILNYRHLINVMYESLRPTNELPEAANNTSLSPLDLGDGPAGTRVAGFNVTTLERGGVHLEPVTSGSFSIFGVHVVRVDVHLFVSCRNENIDQ